MLAAQLVVDMASRVDPTSPAAVIPVRIGLTRLPGLPLDAPAATTRARFDSWLAAQLVAKYRCLPRLAVSLVREGRVLPVLDGLDEMDPEPLEPAAARQLVEALNLPSGPRRWSVVLTCRSSIYEGLGTTVMQDATTVALQPLDAERIIAWLVHRFPGPNGIAPSWSPVVAQLRADPTGRLARTLASPLRLWLATAVHDADPTAVTDLGDLDPNTLDQRLFTRLVPAVVDHHRRATGFRPDAQQVQRWLASLASLIAAGDHAELVPRDLQPSFDQRRWDKLRGRATLIGGPVTTVVLTDSLPLAGVGPLLCFAALTMSRVDRITERVWAQLDEGVRRRLRRQAIPGIGALGLCAAAVGGIGSSGNHVDRILIGLAALAAICLLSLVVLVVTEAVSTVRRPSDVVNRPWTLAVVGTATFGLASGGFAGLVTDLGSAVAFGVLVGLVSGFFVSRWFESLARRRLSGGQALPWRLGRFLDWAHEAGLLRMNSPAIQFRHRELLRFLSGG